MVKLDANVLRYMTRDEFRVLTAVEMGMKNHEFVPTSLICSIARLKKGGAVKVVKLLHKNKLIYHESKQYDGYRLTYAGYDYLALKALVKRGAITALGNQIGVGKESDIYQVLGGDGETMMCLKIHRLGRTSFRAVKSKRDYLLHRSSASWLYMSRLASVREFAYMRALRKHGFPTPEPVEQNRHMVLMSLVDGVPLSQLSRVEKPALMYSKLMNLIVRLAKHGLIHCDFNEFNIMVNRKTEKITLIDFPQMVSTSHRNAGDFFTRDVSCVRRFFRRRLKYVSDQYPKFRKSDRDTTDAPVEIGAMLNVEETTGQSEYHKSDTVSGETVQGSGESKHTADGDEQQQEDKPAARLDVLLNASGFVPENHGGKVVTAQQRESELYQSAKEKASAKWAERERQAFEALLEEWRGEMMGGGSDSDAGDTPQDEENDEGEAQERDMEENVEEEGGQEAGSGGDGERKLADGSPESEQGEHGGSGEDQDDEDVSFNVHRRRRKKKNMTSENIRDRVKREWNRKQAAAAARRLHRKDIKRNSNRDRDRRRTDRLIKEHTL